MASVTWIGAGTGAWDNTANWSNGALPTLLDDVSINTSQTGTITHAAGADTVRSLTINGKPDLAVSGGSLTVNGAFVSRSNTILSAGVLTLNGASTMATFSQTGGKLAGAGLVTITAATALSTGTQSGAGTALAKGGVTLTGAAFALDGGRVLELQGNSAAAGNDVRINLNGVNPATNLSDAGSGVLRIDVGALFDDQAANTGLTIFAAGQGGADTGASAMVNNLGTFRRSGVAASSTISVAFNNTGTLDARTGTLRLTGGGGETGSISLLPAATVEFGGGAHTVNGAKATGTGQILVSGGTVTVGTTFTIGGPLSQTGGLLNGAGVTTVTGLISLSGGAQSGAGTTVAKGGIALSVGSFGLDGGHMLELQGNSAVTGAGVTLNLNAADPNTGLSAAGSGVLRIGAGTLLDDQTAGQTASDGLTIFASNQTGSDTGAGALVDNAGTFRRSGAGVTTISTGFNNTGIADIRAGTLRLLGGGVDTGTFSTLAGGVVEFGGGGHTLNGAKVTGTGQILISGGSVTVDTALLVASDYAQTGGLVNGGGVITLSNPVTLAAGTHSGAGTTVAKSGIALIGTAFALDGGRVLELQSNNSTVTGTGITLDLNGADPNTLLSAAGAGTLRIDAGGVLDDQTSGSGLSILASNQGAGDTGAGALVDNQGTFRRSGAAASSDIAAAFVNAGIVDARTGTLFLDGALTNTATGLLQIKAGATLDARGAFANISGSTLTTGTITIASKGGQPGVFRYAGPGIVTNAATLVMDGNNAHLMNGANDALANLATNAAAGNLTVQGDKIFTTSAGFSNAGMLITTAPASFTVAGTLTNTGSVSLAGGVDAAAALINSGEIGGFGAVNTGVANPGIANTGTVRAAGGALAIGGAVTGATGAIQVDAGASLSLARTSSVGSLVVNATGPAILNIGANPLTIFNDYANAGSGVGDAYDPRAGIAGTGLILAAGGVPARQTLSGGIGAATTGDAVLAMGDLHVGDTRTKFYQIGDVIAAGPALRGAIQTSANGGNLTDARLSGAGVTASNYGPVAAGAFSDPLAVTLSGLAAGALTGQSVHIVNNFANTNSQTLAMTGAVFRLATAGATAPVSFGVVHVGDTVSRVLTLSNTAPASPFSESLDAALGGGAGGVSASGAFTGLAAGASDTSALVLTLDTSTSGEKTGAASLTLTSDGAGIDSLGQTSLRTRAIAITGTVNSHALGAFQILSGGAVLQRDGQHYTLNPGAQRIGAPVAAFNLDVVNAVQGLADLLDGSFTVSGDSAFTNTGLNAFSGLGGGQAGNALSVSLSTQQRGAFSETLTLHATGHNASGFSETLADETLTITGSVAGARSAADFNGDNNSDFPWQHDDGTAVLWDMDGTRIGGGGVFATPGAAWALNGTGDFNADGKADVLWRHTDGSVALWEMNGTGVAGGGIIGNPGTQWRIRGTGDVNGDGYSDIVWQHDDGTAVVWEMNGASVIGGGAVGNPGVSWHVRATGDFNGDGNADIVWQHDSGLVSIWELNGTAVIGGGVLTNPGAAWHVMATGDFNGDGKSDLLWQHDDGTLAIWEMNGTAVTGGGGPGNPGKGWEAKGTGDFNNDGKSDILWSNEDGSAAIWEMDGIAVIGGGATDNAGPGWHLIGTDGMRFLSGASGNGVLTATPAADTTFAFETWSPGSHTIRGFDPLHDIIRLSAGAFSDFAAVQAHSAASPLGTLITLAPNASLLIQGEEPAALTARDFRFV